MRFSLIRLSPGQSTGRIPRRHSGWPPVPATHEAPRRVDSVLAVAVAHLARGPSLRRVVLSTPILATTPSSDFRSTLHHFAGHAYRFRCYRSTDDGTRRALVAGVETDLSCSTMGCVIVPLPLRRRVSGAAHPRSSHRPWPSPLSAGLGTRLSPAVRGGSRRGYRIPLVRSDHLLAAHGDFVMALRQSDLSFRRPPATGPLGRYPGRTLTGKSIAASRTHQIDPPSGDLDIGFIDEPAIARRVSTGSCCIDQQRGETLHPPVDGDVIDLHSALGQQLFNIAIRESVTEVPAHCQHDHLLEKPEAGERRRWREDQTNTATTAHE